MFVEMLLRSEGLTEKDVRIVTMSYPDMLAAFRGKAIDARGRDRSRHPIGEQEGISVRFKKLSSCCPGLNLGVVMYGERLGKDNRDLGMRFMRRLCQEQFLCAQAPVRSRAAARKSRRFFRNICRSKIRKCMRRSALASATKSMSVNVDGKYGLKWQLQHYTERLVPHPPKLAESVDQSFAKAASKATR